MTPIVLLSVLIDQTFGEPVRFHPLIGFGKFAATLENFSYKFAAASKAVSVQRLIGLLTVALSIVPIVAAVWLLTEGALFRTGGALQAVLSALMLYLCLGGRSLTEHAGAVSAALKSGDLAGARLKVALIVSRDTGELNETEIARAAVESVLENGSDAIFGAIFWFLILGAPGAVLYRLANTLDAMWGYKNGRYLHFGWAAAKLDDLLCFLPARLTAFSYLLVGSWKEACHCWRYQAKLWYSPNAGPVMATGAGALRLQLGGPASYHGSIKERPFLGVGDAPGAEDIERAVKLVQRALLLWLIVIIIGGLALHA